MLNKDIICYICTFLNDHNKLNFLLLNKELNLIKLTVRFSSQITISKIYKLKYFDNFINVLVTNDNIILPNNVEHIEVRIPSINISSNNNFAYVRRLTLPNLETSYIPIIKKCKLLESITITRDINNNNLRTVFDSNLNLNKIDFYCGFNEKIYDIFPKQKIKYINLGGHYNQNITFGPDIETVIFEYYFNSNINFDLCRNLKLVEFDFAFDRPIVRCFDCCHSLEKIIFGYKFNQPIIGCFDKCTNLKIIKLGDTFDQPILNTFDMCPIKKIIFGDNFNQSITHSFKNQYGLETIKFGKNFNQNIHNVFDNCHRIKKIILNNNYKEDIIGMFDHCLDLEEIYADPNLCEKYGNVYKMEDWFDIKLVSKQKYRPSRGINGIHFKHGYYSHDIKGDIPNPKFIVSPWNQSSIEWNQSSIDPS